MELRPVTDCELQGVEGGRTNALGWAVLGTMTGFAIGGGTGAIIGGFGAFLVGGIGDILHGIFG
jgi:outer membrane lipoprotein SlyB